MVEEIAFIEVKPGTEDEFANAVIKAGKEIFPRSPGFVSVSLGRGVERPQVFALKLVWETVEDHTEGFVKSDLFAEWGALVGDLLQGTPVVEHWSPIDVA